MGNPENLSAFIKQEAALLGFDACGIAPAHKLSQHEKYVQEWLRAGYQAEMHYMGKNLEMRLDPSLLLPGARSVIVLLKNYHPVRKIDDDAAYRVATYAYGKRYQDVIGEKLEILKKALLEKNPGTSFRTCVDSAPILEKAWAVNAGLGWIGKNSLLLNRKGSYHFIAELITDLPLQYDEPVTQSQCGECRQCIEACPTGALTGTMTLNAAKCISYYTIEHKREIPETLRGKFGNWIFGCDACQLACPWNRFATPHNEPEFAPPPQLLSMKQADWESLATSDFDKIFKNTPLKRTKFEGLKRNIEFLAKKI